MNEHTLLKTSDEFEAILNEFEDGDCTNEDLLAKLESMSMSIEAGVNSFVDRIAEVNSNMTCIKDRKGELTERSNRFKSQIDRFRALLITIVKKHGSLQAKSSAIQYKTPFNTLSVSTKYNALVVDKDALGEKVIEIANDLLLQLEYYPGLWDLNGTSEAVYITMADKIKLTPEIIKSLRFTVTIDDLNAIKVLHVADALELLQKEGVLQYRVSYDSQELPQCSEHILNALSDLKEIASNEIVPEEGFDIEVKAPGTAIGSITKLPSTILNQIGMLYSLENKSTLIIRKA